MDLCLSPGKTPCHPHIPTFESLLLVLVKSGNGFFIFFLLFECGSGVKISVVSFPTPDIPLGMDGGAW